MSSSKTGVLEIYQSYVDRFDRTSFKGTGRDWTPYRFCSEDWLLAVAVTRSSRERYEVAHFGCEDHHDFEPDAGLKAALSFILADSFHRTGKMAVWFCGPRKGETSTHATGYCHGIPRAIRSFAAQLGVQLAPGRKLSHEDGAALYQHMVGLGRELAEKLRVRGIDPLRGAFLLHRGAIGVESLALIAEHSAGPDSVLEGRLLPEQWLAFKRELLILRRGLLAERSRILLEQGLSVEREILATRWVNDSAFQAQADCTLSVVTVTGEKISVPARTPINIEVRPYNQVELRMAERLGSRVTAKHHGFVVVPRDFAWLPSTDQERLLSGATEYGVKVLSIYESLDELDSEALVRLERFATTRMAIEEQRE